MAPDVKFHLSHDAYDHFAELLTPHGIIVRDMARDVHENLQSESTTSESYSGFLDYRGHEYAYRRQKAFSDPSFPWHILPTDSPSVRVFRDGSLSITVSDHAADALEQLFTVLEQIFLDPPRSQPSPRTIRARSRFRILRQFGCFILLILFGAFCFFAIYGLRAFFHAL